jgi:hypothetical protein
MLRASLLGLGVGTLLAAAAAVDGAGPIEAAPAPEPRPAYLALGGTLVDLAAANEGPGCFAPMLDELRGHPHWSIRIDDLEWDDVIDDEPDERHASLVIDAESATWRDDALPQVAALTAAERRDALAAFALDCRVDESLPRNGFGGHYIGVALGEDGPHATTFPSNSPVAVRLLELFGAIRARYVAARAEDLRGFSLELAGMWRGDRDEQGRIITEPHRIEFREPDAPAPEDLEQHLRLLDWAMQQPTSQPAARLVARGTLRAYGTSRPIAVDLEHLGKWGSYGTFHELAMWESVERNADRPDD